MKKARTLSCACTVAGSDSGGGAGIQADLNTFAALGVHGTSAVTCLTAQNPEGLRGIQAASPGLVRSQLEAVFGGFPVAACKTGMLYNAAIIREVARFFESHRSCVLVVDPVMVATSGALLLRKNAIRTLCDALLPLAVLMTPNVAETEQLTGLSLTEPEDFRRAARQLAARYGCAVLVKGGHLDRFEEAMDLYYDGRVELLLTAGRIRGIRTHGTGCTFSAAITAYLARGHTLAKSVALAKDFITQAIGHHYRVGHQAVLGWFGPRPQGVRTRSPR